MKETVNSYGSKNWKNVSKVLKENFGIIQSPKQCRDRWSNYLKIENYSSSFTSQEKNSIFKYFLELGCKWSVLSSIIKTKSENQIKNFLNSTIRRNVRKFDKYRADEEKINCNSLNLLKIVELQKILTAEKTKSFDWFKQQNLSQDTKRQIEMIRAECSREVLETNLLEKELDNILDSLLK